MKSLCRHFQIRVWEQGGGFATENLFMKSLTKHRGNPFLDLPFWQTNNNLNLLIISFKGMFLENTTTENPDSITMLMLKIKNGLFFPPFLCWPLSFRSFNYNASAVLSSIIITLKTHQ